MEGFHERLIMTLRIVMPPNTYEASRGTIEDIITRPRSGLLSLGFLFALYISSGGIMTLISVFNARSHHKSPSAWRLRVKSVWLTLFLVILFLAAMGLLIFSEYAFFYLREKVELTSRTPLLLLAAGKWLLLVALCLTAISSLYFFGTHKLSRWRFISAGSSLATILVIATSLGFNYFIENFSQYNKLYGSIGTLIVILLWIDFNCLQLIIGFELNASIEQARLKGRKTLKLVTG
jgi:membrane protein